MKVAIIIFSPGGNTLKVGRMLENKLLEKEIETQLVDVTRIPEIFEPKKIRAYLNREVEDHDFLCIGSPVYAHHLHYNVINIIKAFPKPDKKWGKLAVPFVTYGGISSGLALVESAKLLKKCGRIPVLAMKLNSEHCMTKLKPITVKINEGMPSKEAVPLIEKLCERIAQLEYAQLEEIPNIIPKLRYQKFTAKLKAKTIFREKIWQRYLYPTLKIDYNKCIKCGICSNVCPVQRIKISENGPYFPKDSPHCIHCTSCMLHCPVEAIFSNVNWDKFNKLLKKSAEGRGPMQSNEKPRSAIYG